MAAIGRISGSEIAIHSGMQPTQNTQKTSQSQSQASWLAINFGKFSNGNLNIFLRCYNKVAVSDNNGTDREENLSDGSGRRTRKCAIRTTNMCAEINGQEWSYRWHLGSQSLPAFTLWQWGWCFQKSTRPSHDPIFWPHQGTLHSSLVNFLCHFVERSYVLIKCEFTRARAVWSLTRNFLVSKFVKFTD